MEAQLSFEEVWTYKHYPDVHSGQVPVDIMTDFTT
jgi:hypothetical protein